MIRKRWLAAVGILALVLALARPYPASADEAAKTQRTLEVTGRATAKVKYDMATISLGVTALETAPLDAYNTMSEKMNTVVEALHKAGVKDEDLKTGTLSLGPEYEWTQDKGQNLKGYRATNVLYISTTQLDKVASLVQVAVTAGSNQLNGISFSVKDADAVQESLLDQAVDDAKAKADRVAKRMGTSVVAVVRVNIMDNGIGPIMYGAPSSTGASYDSKGPAPVFGGNTDLSATVSVTYELQ